VCDVPMLHTLRLLTELKHGGSVTGHVPLEIRHKLSWSEPVDGDHPPCKGSLKEEIMIQDEIARILQGEEDEVDWIMLDESRGFVVDSRMTNDGTVYAVAHFKIGSEQLHNIRLKSVPTSKDFDIEARGEAATLLMFHWRTGLEIDNVKAGREDEEMRALYLQKVKEVLITKTYKN